VRSLSILLLCLCLVIAADAQKRHGHSKAKAKPKTAVAANTLLAEGKYQMNSAAALHGFEEPWSLAQTRLGYELNEQWVIPARGGLNAPQVIDLRVQMVAGFRPVQVHIGDPLLGLTCKIALGAFHCESQGKTTELAIAGPYDFFSPSPWMLGNIVRRAQRVKGEQSSIKLVRIDGTNADGVRMTAFDARVSYVGDDQLELAGARQPVSIYELKAEGKIPDMMVWISEDGVVYAIQDSSHSEQRLELVEFKRYGRM
jgi:hypothetical protein